MKEAKVEPEIDEIVLVLYLEIQKNHSTVDQVINSFEELVLSPLVDSKEIPQVTNSQKNIIFSTALSIIKDKISINTRIKILTAPDVFNIVKEVLIKDLGEDFWVLKFKESVQIYFQP